MNIVLILQTMDIQVCYIFINCLSVNFFVFAVKVTFENRANFPTVSGGGLRHTYILDSFHFHWEAEHTINGHRAPLEGHFVHYAKKYGSFANAVNFPDGVLVLAVMYEVSFLTYFFLYI